jgi:hypothetical protein
MGPNDLIQTGHFLIERFKIVWIIQIKYFLARKLQLDSQNSPLLQLAVYDPKLRMALVAEKVYAVPQPLVVFPALKKALFTTNALCCRTGSAMVHFHPILNHSVTPYTYASAAENLHKEKMEDTRKRGQKTITR